jgi:hypothetical protein
VNIETKMTIFLALGIFTSCADTVFAFAVRPEEQYPADQQGAPPIPSNKSIFQEKQSQD